MQGFGRFLDFSFQHVHGHGERSTAVAGGVDTPVVGNPADVVQLPTRMQDGESFPYAGRLCGVRDSVPTHSSCSSSLESESWTRVKGMSRSTTTFRTGFPTARTRVIVSYRSARGVVAHPGM